MLMKLCIWFGICLSSKWFHLRLTFFSFLKPWAQQTTIHVNCFTYGLGWHTSCHPISKMHIAGEGPGESPSALRFFSYLIRRSSLKDIKCLAKNKQGSILSDLPDVYVRSFLSLSHTVIKFCYTKIFSGQIWSLVPDQNPLLQRSQSCLSTLLAAATFHLFVVGKNLLIVKVSILISKHVFEPRYNDLKFRVWNYSYVCTNLIIKISHVSQNWVWWCETIKRSL